jgi:hypothetical protein
MAKPTFPEPPLLEKGEYRRFDQYMFEVHNQVFGIGSNNGVLDNTNIGINVAETDSAETISGQWDFSTHPTGLDHTQISNIGTKTHVEIDTHIDDDTLHYLEEDISHENIQDIGSNAHSAIDTHMGSHETDGDGLKHTATNLGFYSTTPIAKPTVTGAKGGNVALASLLTALVNLGLIIDNTT